MSTNLRFELRCRECQSTWGNQPIPFCQNCFSPLEVAYDWDRIRKEISKDKIASRATNLWRYKELLPLPEQYDSSTPAGFTPLVKAAKLGEKLRSRSVYIKNDAVCFPTLSFKDRVVAVALTQARNFGFDVVSCSSTGNLANAVAAQAARAGFKACIFIPADLETAKVLGTQVYGAQIVRIDGNYDHVNRLCSQIADKHRWGFVNEVLPADRLMERAWELARLLESGPPLVYAAIKEIVREAEGSTFQTAMNKVTKRQFATVDRLYSSEDQLEGARAFAEKRNPIWKGQ